MSGSQAASTSVSRPLEGPAAATFEPVPTGRPGRNAWILLGVTLVLLLAHSWLYRFLTDDAFISFRYSVNLAHGQGLVFNPGMERVEGYSNFLWVLMLAALDVVGLAPEHTALPLSFLFTIALWAVVAWFGWRQRREGEPSWLAAVPALMLAVTRSVAVWSTSGLETRLFEALVVSGALRLVVEVETLERDGKPRLLSPWAFALATLTRPDGLLISLAAFAVAALHLGRVARQALPRWLAGLVPFAVLVGGHLLFRRAYYGDWLPNTYYAKVDGRTWWSSGFTYLSAFALEYGAILWLPLVAFGALFNVQRGRAFTPLLFAAVVVPHTLYVASIGGDHFEYRPLDLYFPFAFLLAADGLRALLARRVAVAFAGAWLALALLGLWDIPWQSHVQSPPRYLTGFPGTRVREPLALEYLDPARDPLCRWWPMRAFAELHRDQVRTLTRNFVAIRQEEHRMFLDTVVPEGHRLRALMDQGVLPRDLYVAMGSVGAIPYYSNVRTLDKVGLTDAHVAHSPIVRRRLMAHDKDATIEYARDRGVDLWTYHPVHLIVSLNARTLLVAVRDALVGGKDAWVAPLSDSEVVLCRLPKGVDAAQARMPSLRFVPIVDSAFIAGWSAHAAAPFEAALARDSSDFESRGQLAYIQMIRRDYAGAAGNYARVVASAPRSPEALEYLGVCRYRTGDAAGALGALEGSVTQYRQVGDFAAAARVESDRLAILSALVPKAAAKHGAGESAVRLASWPIDP